MEKTTFLGKVSDGLVIGIMVALVGAVAGLVWKGFDDAKTQLKTANKILDTQVNKTNESFKDFNNEQNRRNKDQDRFNKEQISNIKEILNMIENMETELALLAKNAQIPYTPRINKETITRLENDFGKIQESLEEKQQIQEKIQEDLGQYQEEQQMQQQGW